jgi:hypothetical protein
MLAFERNRAWLFQAFQGKKVAEIANSSRSSRRRVRQGIARAAGGGKPDEGDTAGARRPPWPPLLEPLFGVAPFVPRMRCPHKGPIRKGSILCCMKCHRSGQDGHPALVRNPRTDPKPDRKPPAPVAKLLPHKETRRERRLRQFGPARKSA